MRKQSFTMYLEDGRVLGCSFRKANYNDSYFAWITEYTSVDSYNNPKITDTFINYRHIVLGNTKEGSIEEIKKYVENNILTSGGYEIK